MGTVNSQVNTVFTVDLAPFVDGLKTMLSMAQTTGQQLNTMLTVTAKAPDFTGLENQLQGITERTQDYVEANQSNIDTTQSAIPVEQSLTQETGKAEKALFKKSDTLRGMRREAVMGMGALSFLMMSMQQLSGASDDASSKTSELSKGLKEGVTAGFEMSMMLLMVNPELGLIAVAIGVIAGAGIALAKVFMDDTDAIARQKAALDDLSASMKGASIQELQNYRDNLQQVIDARQKEVDMLTERRKRLGNQTREDFAREKAAVADVKSFTAEREAIDKELASKNKSYAEERAFAAKAEVDSISDSYEKELADAKLTHEKEQAEWIGHHDALIASDNKYIAAVAAIHAKQKEAHQKEIDQAKAERAKEQADRQKEAEQLASARQTASDAWFERDLNTIRIEGLKKGLTEQQVNDQVYAAQRARLQAQLNSLNKTININDADQIKQQANLAKQISAIDEKLYVDEKAITDKEVADEKAKVDAKIELSKEAIQKGIEQYDSAKTLGANYGNLARNFIEQEMAKAVAADLASVFASVPFPFNILAASAAGMAVEALFDAVIPKFGTGAIVTKPTMAMIAEAGESEAVIPLSKLQDMMNPTPKNLSPQQSTNLQINISGNVMTKDFVNGQLKKELIKIVRSTGLTIDKIFVDTNQNLVLG